MNVIERAYRDLVGSTAVAITRPLEPQGLLGDRAFECALPIPPNRLGLPTTASVRVRIPAVFPNAKAEFTPLDPRLTGFAHQDGRTHAFCLRPDKQYSLEPSRRLREHVESAVEWLADAAMGTLLRPGQHWELPDFRVERKDQPREVFTLEDAQSYETWARRTGQHGTVRFVAHASRHALVAMAFRQRDDVVLEHRCKEPFLDRTRNGEGAWCILSSHVYDRHRPARSFAELEYACAREGVPLWSILRSLLRAKPLGEHHYLLIGAPIPTIVGAPPTHLHWQPIALKAGAIPGFHARPKKRRVRSASDEDAVTCRLRGALRPTVIPWSDVTAFPAERLEKRGVLAPAARVKSVALLGGGALGSFLANHLVRGGMPDVRIFDHETLDLDNVPRHLLPSNDVGKMKALALARHLNGIYPNALVRGFGFKLPPYPSPTKKQWTAWQALHTSDVLIDCTAEPTVLAWASEWGKLNGRLVLHTFINQHARMLTLCASGKHIACGKVAQKLFADVSDGRTSIAWEDYDPADEVLFPGAGCWHATFPALGSHIDQLATSVLPIITLLLSRPRTSRGFAAVLRRHDLEVDFLRNDAPMNLVNMPWKANYR